MNTLRPNRLLPAAIAFLAVLSACSSDDDDEGIVDNASGDLTMPSGIATEPAAPGGDITLIAGLFDATRTIGADTDVRYALFDATGLYTLYDYEQDALGEGLNCYRPTEPVTVTPNGGDVYTVNERVTTIMRTATGLELEFVDSTDEDEDGDTTETLMQVWPALEGLSTDELLDCRAAE